jgi:hypothetical protein
MMSKLAILILAVAVFAVAAYGQDAPKTLNITVDRATVETSPKGAKYASITMHFQRAPEKSFELMCIIKNADCFELRVGGHYGLAVLPDNDPDGYTDYQSFRIFGSDTSAVYLDPTTPTKKKDGAVVSSN